MDLFSLLFWYHYVHIMLVKKSLSKSQKIGGSLHRWNFSSQQIFNCFDGQFFSYISIHYVPKKFVAMYSIKFLGATPCTAAWHNEWVEKFPLLPALAFNIFWCCMVDKLGLSRDWYVRFFQLSFIFLFGL